MPYLPQNPRIDVAEQDRSSMPVQIAAGAGLEAIVFGTFGVKITENSLTIKPYNHEDIGKALLENVKWNNHSFSIQLDRKTFSVYKNGQLVTTKFYGESYTIKK